MLILNRDIAIDRKVLLSTVWIFVLINMVYADIIGMLRPGYVELLERMSKELNSETVLTFSVLMEIPIGMILLSRILPRKSNRTMNFVAVPVSVIYVIFGGLDDPPISYLFFGTVEILAMLCVLGISYKWKKEILSGGNQ